MAAGKGADSLAVESATDATGVGAAEARAEAEAGVSGTAEAAALPLAAALGAGLADADAGPEAAGLAEAAAEAATDGFALAGAVLAAALGLAAAGLLAAGLVAGLVAPPPQAARRTEPVSTRAAKRWFMTFSLTYSPSFSAARDAGIAASALALDYPARRLDGPLRR
jgi:hypothetical protein